MLQQVLIKLSAEIRVEDTEAVGEYSNRTAIVSFSLFSRPDLTSARLNADGDTGKDGSYITCTWRHSRET